MDGSIVPQPGLLAFGNGQGGFQVATASQFPWQALQTVHPREVLFADWNGDGLLDVYVASHGWDASPWPGEQNMLFLSNGDGSWRNATSTLPQVADFSHSAATGDVNGDGKLDIVVGNQLGQLLSPPYVLLNDGAGHFQKVDNLLPTSPGQALAHDYQSVTTMALVDLDADGHDDLVLGPAFSTEAKSRPAQILWGKGQGFASAVTTQLPQPSFFGKTYLTYDIQAIDVNFDGLQDLILAYQRDVLLGGWELQVLVNQGNRAWSDQTTTYLPNVSDRTAGMPSSTNALSQYWVQFLWPKDVNHDGRMDFFMDARGITSAPSTLPLLYVHQPDGTFETMTVKEIAPDKPWLFDYATQYARWDGNGGVVNFSAYDGKAVIRSLALDIAPVEPAFQDFTQPVQLVGGSGVDQLFGGRGNDVLHGLGGNDFLHGGEGTDQATFTGQWAAYTVSNVAGGLTVSGSDGTDRLTSVERLRFDDVAVAMDLDGHAGQVARTLGAVFGAGAVSNQQYVGIGLSLLDGGMGYEALMQLALQVKLGAAPSHADVVDLLYTNVVGVAPTPAVRDFYVNLLDSQTHSAASLGILAAETSLNADNIDLVGLNQTGLAYLSGVL